MQQMQARYREERDKADSDGKRSRAESRMLTWVRAEFALFLLEATGRRRGSVMQLRWQDFDFPGQRVTWRGVTEKTKKTWEVVYPREFFETAREFQRSLGAVGGYVFPKKDDSDRHASPELASQWIRKAEEVAGLTKLNGGLTHSYRRKWRSERSHLPVKAVAHAGGWDDVGTMLRCYDHPEDEDILAVTSEPRKRRELAKANTDVPLA
jgi:integrase